MSFSDSKICTIDFSKFWVESRFFLILKGPGPCPKRNVIVLKLIVIVCTYFLHNVGPRSLGGNYTQIPARLYKLLGNTDHYPLSRNTPLKNTKHTKYWVLSSLQEHASEIQKIHKIPSTILSPGTRLWNTKNTQNTEYYPLSRNTPLKYKKYTKYRVLSSLQEHASEIQKIHKISSTIRSPRTRLWNTQNTEYYPLSRNTPLKYTKYRVLSALQEHASEIHKTL